MGYIECYTFLLITHLLSRNCWKRKKYILDLIISIPLKDYFHPKIDIFVVSHNVVNQAFVAIIIIINPFLIYNLMLNISIIIFNVDFFSFSF